LASFSHALLQIENEKQRELRSQFKYKIGKKSRNFWRSPRPSALAEFLKDLKISATEN